MADEYIPLFCQTSEINSRYFRWYPVHPQVRSIRESALLTCTALLVSKVRGHAFSWPHHINMIFAACRLRLAFLLIGTPIVGVTLGRALYFGFVPVIIQTVREEDQSPNHTKENRL
jgi:hypothetical protein